MSFAQCPKNRGLSRDALKWLQSLDLSCHPKNVRRDFSNGFLVAEIFSHYYPQDFPVQTYNKGTSLTAKQKNWSRIERALEKQNRYLVKELVDGTIHCKPGAAELLVHEVYSILTNQSIKAVQSPVTDFTDQDYQVLLPALARSTASKAIKNNLRQTEIMAEPNINSIRRKAEVILHRHREHKAAERMLSPERFKAKPRRQLVVPSSQGNEHFDSPAESCSASAWRGTAVPFKEIKVHQPVRQSPISY